MQRTDQEETHMYEVDARGLSCPEPLMLVSDALKSHPGEKLKVLVSEPHSRTNIEKFVKSRGPVSYTHLDVYKRQVSFYPLYRELKKI